MADIISNQSVDASQYSSLYYPAAGTDFKTVVEILGSFSSIGKVAMNDLYFPFAEQPDSPHRKVHPINDAIREHFDIVGEIKDNPQVDFTRDVFQVRRKDDGKPLELILLSGTFSKMDPTYLQPPSVHVVKVPSDSAALSYAEGFYAKIISDMTIGDLLLVRRASLPLYRQGESAIGLESVDSELLDLPEPRLEDRFGKFLSVVDGWKAYRKTCHVEPDEINNVWFEDHDIEPYKATWRSMHDVAMRWLD